MTLEAISEAVRSGTVVIDWYWLNVLKDRYSQPIPEQANDPFPTWCKVEEVPSSYQIFRVGGCAE